jgi:aminoglycoside phosphotransferase (APT) family kinase protein
VRALPPKTVCVSLCRHDKVVPVTEHTTDSLDRTPVPVIDASLVGRLVREQFPQWGHLPVRQVELDGWDNCTFRLGDEMTVRLPSSEGYRLQVAKEQRWLPILAPHLPLPIPVPLAQGLPGQGYPFAWSVCRWLDGENASIERIDDLSEFALTLADFLNTLRRVDATDGPLPGQHNFFRGGPLDTYDAETRRAIDALTGRINTDAVTTMWDAAMAATWQGPPVWFHGDVAAGNLLVRDGRLAAVIDFGTSGIGDPACDVVIAWTLLSGESREAFRDTLSVDSATWARGRGWALWKALITLVDYIDNDPVSEATTRRVIDDVLEET